MFLSVTAYVAIVAEITILRWEDLRIDIFAVFVVMNAACLFL